MVQEEYEQAEEEEEEDRAHDHHGSNDGHNTQRRQQQRRRRRRRLQRLVELNVQFALGPGGSGAVMHYHQPAVNYLAFGSKRWSLLEPAAALYSDIPSRTWVEQFVDGGHGDDEGDGGGDGSPSRGGDGGGSSGGGGGSGVFGANGSTSSTRDALSSAAANASASSSSASAAAAANASAAAAARIVSRRRHLQCTQYAGDVLILPLYYGHATLNLQASVGFAFELAYEPAVTVYPATMLADAWASATTAEAAATATAAAATPPSNKQQAGAQYRWQKEGLQ